MSNVIIGKLKQGDIVVVSNALTGLSEYPVLRIEGKKAITKFRDFHINIYPNGYIYEYGRNITTNYYWITNKDKSNE
jgi:hypothetical protein